MVCNNCTSFSFNLFHYSGKLFVLFSTETRPVQVFCVHLCTWLKMVSGFQTKFYIYFFCGNTDCRGVLIGLIRSRYQVLEISHAQVWDFHGT